MTKSLTNMNITNKKVLLRADLNVPLENSVITDDNRIKAILPTLKYLVQQKAKVIIFSHLGRVKTEADKAHFSLQVVAEKIAFYLQQKVKFVPETQGNTLNQAVGQMLPGDVLVVQNTRFEDVPFKKESKNDPELGKYWASLGDVFVNDAFGTCHRTHASNVGIATYIKEKCFGFLVEKEISFLKKIVQTPQRPLVAVLGGSKVSDKIGVIRSLLQKVDVLLIGGGMSYTCLKAKCFNIGTSLLEADKIPLVKELLASPEGKKIVLPKDFVCGKEFLPTTQAAVYSYDNISDDVMGLDIGPQTIELFKTYLQTAQTVVWNGPVGVFEFEQFSKGTKALAQTISNLSPNTTTIIGGGDSAAAVFKFGLDQNFSHISTGGGAFLEFLEGKPMPGLACMEKL
ncbi:phosphoglycerate kinase [Paulownia witches'-broom phytoplasma]|uniref:Phosphoglycerate kinase n=1 Tax=Paulownia witches'-broom phytoplasma TaxID=39647 RepID=A0ABX8TNN5_9MOLU|nr:phosphoglycerate kinase [Paulownia witches'-broom phytoplasma]QYC30974.1 phosphoglycerate kinase [Paulownia witches'-broom phytoplasma]GLH60707.1 phosphoglycerate kinase [Paulownia witches'-broom phytoplasma]